jgi:CRISPR/Cas system CSM-associated protein Csm4 (group 5 of RAMP superfamily)
MALIEVKLRPTGPWRAGHRTGDRERVDVVYHSDALYSALTHAMRVLGWLEPWLDATARSLSPVVRFSSLYPFVGKTRLIASPRPFAVKLVPLELARGGAFDKTRWQADVPSQCLIPHGSHAPFQVSIRSASAVDRITGTGAEPHRIACLEFASNAGWWGVFEVTDSDWEAKIKAAFRLLADSGFGGERSRGWGRSSEPVFSTATALFPDRAPNGEWWLLGLFSPAAEDRIDWTKSAPSVTERGGWTDSPQGSGAKKLVRMIEEGSVLAAESLAGRAVDVAPDGFLHAVYRNGQGLAVPLPAAAPPVSEVVTSPAPEPPAQFEANSESVVEPEAVAAEEPAPPAEAPVQLEPNLEPVAEPELAPAEEPAASVEPEPPAEPESRPGSEPAAPEVTE